MRVLAFVTFALLAGPALAGDVVLNIPVHGSATVELQANPSTGYAWRVDPAQSTHLNRVKVEEAGSVSSAPPGMVGAPVKQSWQFSGVSAGSAKITLVYGRAWEKSIANTQVVRVRVQ